MQAKEYGQFIRPTLGVTRAILRGYAVLMFISEQHVAHDSSWTSEVVAHSFHVMAEQFPNINLRAAHLSCHGDHSGKELKNKTLI